VKRINCVETPHPPGGVFSHNFEFSQFDINTENVLYIFYNIAQRNMKKEIFPVDIELYQHGSSPISVQNLQMLYYKSF
jgi:hypothetical protein